MNERLTVLLETAKDLALHVYRNVDDDVSYELLVNEIFADLIVKECANVASNFVRGPGGDHGVKRVIQQHFGVEE